MHATCSSVQQGDTCHMPHAPQQTTAKAETMSQQQQQGKMSDAMMMMILCLIATTDKVLKFMAHREGGRVCRVKRNVAVLSSCRKLNSKIFIVVGRGSRSGRNGRLNN